jgi:hypothetical protein
MTANIIQGSKVDSFSLLCKQRGITESVRQQRKWFFDKNPDKKGGKQWGKLMREERRKSHTHTHIPESKRSVPDAPETSPL